MSRTWSASCSMLVLWVTKTTVVPPALRCRTASVRAVSPAASRLALGSSSTTTEGFPNNARANPIRCRCPPDSDCPLSPISVLYPFGICWTISCTPARRAAQMIPAWSASRNVLRHRAGKELDVLRKVADIRSKLVWIELIDRETIEPDGSRHRRPDPQEHTDQARFAGGAPADNGKCLTLFKLERDAAQYRSAGARRRGKNLLEHDRSLRSRQFHPPHILRVGTEEVL